MSNFKEKVLMVFRTVVYCWKTIIKFSWFWTTILIIIALVSSFSIVIHAEALKRLVNNISDGVGIYKMWPIVIVWAVSILAMNIFKLTDKYINIHINEQVERKYIPVIIDKYNNIEYFQFERKETQDLFQYVNASSHKDIISMFNISVQIITSVITLIELIYIFMNASYWIGAASVAITVPLIVLNLRSAYVEMRQRWTMTKDIRKRYYFQSLFADKNALQEIKMFNSEEYFINESEKLTQVINEELKKNIGLVAKLKLILAVILCLFTSMVIIGASKMMLEQRMQLGVFVVLIENIVIYISSGEQLSNSISSIIRISEKVKLVFDFFKLPDMHIGKGRDIVDKKTNNEFIIEFEHVSFSYPECNEKVLNDVSFRIKKREVVSFVGINGSGKTTIIKLLCGLYKPDVGMIRINGADVSGLSAEQIRKELSVVFQDGQHYQLSLRENIGIGNTSLMDNDEILTHALTAAGVKELFGLLNGLDQNLGTIEEDAVDLSGGEWQRVLIARAFVSDSSVLVLDEPIASLDPIAECELYNTIYHSIINHNKTSILISHRLASCVFSDRIMVLKEGKICETGSHNELLGLNGYYAEMFLKQQSWYK